MSGSDDPRYVIPVNIVTLSTMPSLVLGAAEQSSADIENGLIISPGSV